MSPAVDEYWMGRALNAARRGMGNTAENPSVGCVILDKNSKLCAVANTAPGGRPHAETQAIAIAGTAAKGGTAYVTLEPCAHTGKTPPCAKALVKAGLSHVVIATRDPDPRVSGKGIDILRTAGISVETGVLENKAKQQLAGFISRITRKRPHIILKMAVSSDGKIAESAGMQTTITGPRFKQYAHFLRARVDAILVGAGTFKIDKPSLTCRLPGMQDRSPRAIIVGGDKTLAVPDSALHFPGKTNFSKLLEQLADKGINTVLVEGGAKIAASLLKANLIDEAIIATAPKTIGEQGVNAFFDLPLTFVTDSDHFSCQNTQNLGKDVVRHYLHIKGQD